MLIRLRFQGLPNKKILNYFLWGGHLARPYTRAGETPTPQDWVIYLLEVPHVKLTPMQHVVPLQRINLLQRFLEMVLATAFASSGTTFASSGTTFASS
ncbi:MAG: hypothetical protein RMX35_29150, partial [Nostoc sp. DcaGUA01]|nr:hypothetical protein [Nostoc sp. DcaGUA01]